ncbi:hypothetical protein SCP_0703130 [Sparassis crispa]|uniref:RNA-dependent RNA polymerase n=1 Tax=Sparassis crispa TaxID=139825 RepID=A0A401GSE1_9APHY|nr:hypothetical protein SCP_0703130 [Sparassis crispa]GBE85127.1 hypothetical protein SCP_0703130 [Sparassis crispa]
MIYALQEVLANSWISVLYTPSKIEALLGSRAESCSVVFLKTNSPPVFLTESDSDGSALSELLEPRPERIWSPWKDQPMPSGCHSLMLEFSCDSDAEDFIYACRSGLSLDYSPKPSIRIRDNLFSPEILKDLDKFLSKLQFELAFEIEKTITRSILSALEVLSMKREITNLQRDHGHHASQIFHLFASLVEDGGPSGRKRRRPALSTAAEPWENYQVALTLLLRQAVKHFVEEQQRPRPAVALPLVESTVDAAYLCYHLIFTPTRHILEGPLPDQSNSVLRRFGHHECFLRVSFQDENQTKLRRNTEFSIVGLLRKRYHPLLLNGLRITGRPYELLGYSMSGLREHSVWFVTPFEDRNGQRQNAQTIRNSLGDFSRKQGRPTLLLRQPARLSARWAQAFSATDPSVTLRPDQIDLDFPDKISETGQLMTDGCSPISVDLARDIWRSMQIAKKRSAKFQGVPSAFQFRLGGAKGVVVQDPSIPGKCLRLRPSQIKFDAPDDLTFNVQSTSSQPKAMFLNRPLIVLMEYLQVDCDRIIQLQDNAIRRAQSVRSSFINASKVFEQHGLGETFHLPTLFRNVSSILHLRMMDGIEEGALGWANDLVEGSLHCAETHILRELKYRAHIEVPGSYTLLGVSDEWGCLREGEIYATVHDPKTGQLTPITGSVAITRSPQIHPGDLQVVQAVIRPELEHLTNVVVFSCEGQRSLASCLGGGDLDGDDFNIILDPKLIPPTVKPPGAYESLPIKTTARECGIADVVDFIFDYIESDLIGYIAISHLRFSDLKDPGCDECLQLAKFASQAVDFPKTGTPVNFFSLPRIRNQPRPDFLAREGDDLQSNQYYTSKKLLGILSRRVPVKTWYPGSWNKSYPPSDCAVIIRALSSINLPNLGLPAHTKPSKELSEEMQHLLDAYCDQLLAIAKVHTITKTKDAYISEAELVSGTIMANWSDHRRQKDAVSAMNLQTSRLVRAVRAEFQESGSAAANEDNYKEDYEDRAFREAVDDDETPMMLETFKRAWAAWYVAEISLIEYSGAFGPQSFGLIALGRMLEIVKRCKSS